MNTHKRTGLTLLLTILFFLPNFLAAQSNNNRSVAITASAYPKLVSQNSTSAKNTSSYDIKNEGLKARDFGKTRTQAARLKLLEGQRKAGKVTSNAYHLIEKSNKKIRLAKSNLATATAKGNLSSYEIQQRQRAIKKAEHKLAQLKESIYSLRLDDANKSS